MSFVFWRESSFEDIVNAVELRSAGYELQERVESVDVKFQ